MPIVSDDSAWWPTINASIIASYFIVAASVAVWYDWALTLAQEVELIWRQRWSLMTALYLCLRYLGLLYAVISILAQVPTIPLTDTGCHACFITLNSITVVSTIMLGVIMIVRLYAMYQQSRKVLILLVVTFLPVSIIDGTFTGRASQNSSAVVLILSGSYVCSPSFNGNGVLLIDIISILSIAWEVLALCLAAWIAVKHIRELPQSSARGTLGGCFKVLIKTHVVYFTSFVAMSCFQIGYLSPKLSGNPYSLETMIYLGFSQVFILVQLVVMGPRLILGIREYNAALVAESDSGTVMSSVAFQERVHLTTDGGV